MNSTGAIVAFVQRKGGTGKTTVATNVAVTATEGGLAVAIVDTDPQASVVMWKAARSDQGPTVFAIRPLDLAGWLKGEGKDFDLIVIDTTGHDTDTLADVARIADPSVIVTQPTRLAIAVAALLQQAFVNAAVPYAILLSQTPPRMTSRLAHWLENHRSLGTVVDTQLAYRVAYQDAVALGQGAIEYETQRSSRKRSEGRYRMDSHETGDRPMNRRANPSAAFEASARQLRQDLRTLIPTSRTGETRTTYSISENARQALQLLAVQQKCKLNDLVALAIEDFLASSAPFSSSEAGNLYAIAC
jgi:chromosome partitioning protein